MYSGRTDLTETNVVDRDHDAIVLTINSSRDGIVTD